MPEVLLGGFLGTPAWMWLGFLAIVFDLLVFDRVVLHRSSREMGVRESVYELTSEDALAALSSNLCLAWALTRIAAPKLAPPYPRPLLQQYR